MPFSLQANAQTPRPWVVAIDGFVFSVVARENRSCPLFSGRLWNCISCGVGNASALKRAEGAWKPVESVCYQEVEL